MADRLRSEDGVSGIIVAIAVVALLAMVGLSVDGGGLLLKKRSMVNATDAAALSYGISCIQGKNDATASSDATSTAQANVSEATQVSRTGSCGAGKVTVTYEGTQPRYFLPIVGISSSGAVRSTASAAWGGAGGSVTPPIEVTQGGIQSCNFPGFPGPPPGPETQCTLTFPKTGNGTWGGINVTNQPANPATCKSVAKFGWNVCAPPNSITDVRSLCGGMSAQEGKKAMDGNTAVMLNPSGTTWVCADQGQTDSIWMEFNDPSHIGKVFCFPLTDQTKVYPPAPASPVAYDVIGFIPLRVVQWFKQGNNLFLTLSWPGPQPCGTTGGGPPGFGAYEIGLSG